MIEGTPGKPYGGLLAHFNIVEANMKHRRDEVKPVEIVENCSSNFIDPNYFRSQLCWGKTNKYFP